MVVESRRGCRVAYLWKRLCRTQTADRRRGMTRRWRKAFHTWLVSSTEWHLAALAWAQPHRNEDPWMGSVHTARTATTEFAAFQFRRVHLSFPF